MRAEMVFAALLTTDAGVIAALTPTPAIPTPGAARVFGGMAPDEYLAPLLIYRKLGATRTPILGDGPTQASIVDATLELMICGRTYAECKALGEAARLALVDKVGPDVAGTGVNVQNLELQSEGEDIFNADLREFAQVFTFRAVHTEGVTP